ncbi:MAG: hypothetical protein WD824_11010 [Cyclobacteriaceae bacterium]
MNRQPDKLFRDKLQGYQKPVSPEVWKKISENLHQKNRSVVWLKIAASILLLACAGVLIFPLASRTPAPVISEKPVPSSKQERQDAAKIIPKENNLTKEEKRASASPLTKPSAKARVRKTEEVTNQAPPIEVPKATDEEVFALAVTESADEIPEADEPNKDQSKTTDPSVENNDDIAQRVTIVYNAKEVNEKYLNKNFVAEATPDEKESSTFRKLLDKAYDLKHNQDPLGDLRQKKNEILALNFKNDKQRNEND